MRDMDVTLLEEISKILPDPEPVQASVADENRGSETKRRNKK